MQRLPIALLVVEPTETVAEIQAALQRRNDAELETLRTENAHLRDALGPLPLPGVPSPGPRACARCHVVVLRSTSHGTLCYVCTQRDKMICPGCETLRAELSRVRQRLRDLERLARVRARRRARRMAEPAALAGG